MNLYEKTVVALVHTLAKHPYIVSEHRFVLSQSTKMPDFLGLAMRVLTLCFAIWVLLVYGSVFHRLQLIDRTRILSKWRSARLGPCRDLVRFYETLTLFSMTSSKAWT